MWALMNGKHQNTVNFEAAPPSHSIRPFIHVSLFILIPIAIEKCADKKRPFRFYTFPACQSMWSNDCRFVLFILCNPPSHLAWIASYASVYAAATNKMNKTFSASEWFDRKNTLLYLSKRREKKKKTAVYNATFVWNRVLTPLYGYNHSRVHGATHSHTETVRITFFFRQMCVSATAPVTLMRFLVNVKRIIMNNVKQHSTFIIHSPIPEQFQLFNTYLFAYLISK